MQTRARTMKNALFASALALLVLALLPRQPVVRAAGKPVMIVMGASSTIKDIDFAILRRAFSGLAAEVSGKRLIPINHANGTPLRVAFDRVLLGLQPGDVGKYWIDKRIRDEGSPPKTVPSPELAVRIAASLPNAITYASQELLNASVKVLTVGGKAPGQAGYPIMQ